MWYNAIMKKILLSMLFFTAFTGIVNANTLWEYTEGNLPSIAERAVIYAEFGFTDEYRGTAEQNTILLDALQLGELGATNAISTPQAFFETSLQAGISSSAVTMTLISNLDASGAVSASSTYAFVIDEGTASQEMVVADCFQGGAKTCDNMTRGLSPITGTSSVSSLQKAHRRGASVKITDGPLLLNITRIINGIGTFPNILSYTSQPTFTDDEQIITKKYADDGVNQGAATSSPTTSGISEQATAIEVASSTQFDTDNPHYINSEQGSSTPTTGCDGTSTSGALCVLVADNDGKINQGYIDLAEDRTYSGAVTFNTATTTLNATTSISATIGSPLTKNGVDYFEPSVDGASSTVKATDGSGNLSWNTTSDLGAGFFLVASTTDDSLIDSETETTWGTGDLATIKANQLGSNGGFVVNVFVSVYSDSSGTDSGIVAIKLGSTKLCNVTLPAADSSSNPAWVKGVIFNTASTTAQASFCTVQTQDGDLAISEGTANEDTTADLVPSVTMDWSNNGAGTETLTISQVFVTMFGK